MREAGLQNTSDVCYYFLIKEHIRVDWIGVCINRLVIRPFFHIDLVQKKGHTNNIFCVAFYHLMNSCDPVGILTQDLQNRNLTFYTAELRSHSCFAGTKIRIFPFYQPIHPNYSLLIINYKLSTVNYPLSPV